MVSQDGIQKVQEFIRKNSGPNVTSLSEGTHLFYFHRDDWRKSPLVLVNKNGNYCRLMRQGDGNWICVDTWNALFEFDGWMHKMKARNTDPERLLAMVSDGSGRAKRETPCLFPKGAFAAGRRRACVRYGIAEVSMNQASGIFTLYVREETHVGHGKVWESTAAAVWMIKHFPGKHESAIAGEVENPFERAALMEQVHIALEDNPLWGAFG